MEGKRAREDCEQGIHEIGHERNVNEAPALELILLRHHRTEDLGNGDKKVKIENAGQRLGGDEHAGGGRGIYEERGKKNKDAMSRPSASTPGGRAHNRSFFGKSTPRGRV